jgi:hypothetical protein
LNATGLVVAAAKFVGLADSFVFVHPLIRPVLRLDLIGACVPLWLIVCITN